MSVAKRLFDCPSEINIQYKKLKKTLTANTTTVAFGSDIRGSLHIPSSFCGVEGFRPPIGQNRPDLLHFGRTDNPEITWNYSEQIVLNSLDP